VKEKRMWEPILMGALIAIAFAIAALIRGGDMKIKTRRAEAGRGVSGKTVRGSYFPRHSLPANRLSHLIVDCVY
jgi:hypothetical protein